VVEKVKNHCFTGSNIGRVAL